MTIRLRHHSKRTTLGMRRLQLVLCAILVLTVNLTCVAAAAIEPTATSLSMSAADPAFLVKNWQLAEGLPQVSVHALAQTPEGYLWIGTQSGLVRFDGTAFTIYDKRSQPALPAHSIRSLLVDRAGDLWVGTMTGDVLRKTETAFAIVDGLPKSPVLNLTATSDGAIWIGTFTAGAVQLKGGKLRSFTMADGLPSDTVIAVFEAADHAILIVTSHGSVQMRAGRIQPVPLFEDIPDRAAVVVTRDRRNTFWSGGQEGVFRGNPLNREFFRPPTGMPNANVRALFALRNGGILAGGFSGVWRAASADAADAQLLSTASQVTALLEDRERNIWVGTLAHGLYRLIPRRIEMLGAAKGMPQDIVWSVLEDQDGSVWIGTDNGLTHAVGTTYRPIAAFLEPKIGIHALAARGDGAIWFGGPKALYRRLNDTAETILIGGALADATINALFSDEFDRLWIGTTKGLYLLDSDELQSFTTEHGLSDNWVSAIIPGPNDDLWIGTARGLSRIQLSTKRIYQEQEVPLKRISGLTSGSDGTLWISTADDGLMRLRRGELMMLPSLQGVPNASICSVLEDADANLWIATNRGIARVLQEHLQGLDVDAGRPIAATLFDESDGMASRECVGGSQPSSIRRRDGTLLFATVRGVAAIDPSKIEMPTTPARVVLEQLRVDQELQPLRNGIQIPAASRSLEFRYTAINLGTPEKTRFRYRLSGFDDRWTDAGRRREAYFTNIPHGHYQFEVATMGSDGSWSDQAASLKFTVRAPFYRTGFFYAIVAGIVALLAVAAHRFRMLQLRSKNAVLTERNRIALEIHDALAEGLIAIKLQVEMGKQLLRTQPGLALTHLERAQNLADSSVEEAHESIWALRETSHCDGDLAVGISNLVGLLAGHSPLKINIEIRGELPLLEAARFHHVMRIIREALINCLRHANALSTTIAASCHARILTVTIRDDGVGFDVSKPATGTFGIKGMHERSQRIGGAIQVRSARGDGTCVELHVPLDQNSGQPK